MEVGSCGLVPRGFFLAPFIFYYELVTFEDPYLPKRSLVAIPSSGPQTCSITCRENI